MIFRGKPHFRKPPHCEHEALAVCFILSERGCSSIVRRRQVVWSMAGHHFNFDWFVWAVNEQCPVFTRAHLAHHCLSAGRLQLHVITLTFMYIWLVVWNMNFMTFHILGMSSSQLTKSIIFQRDWNHQPAIVTGVYKSPFSSWIFPCKIVIFQFVMLNYQRVHVCTFMYIYAGSWVPTDWIRQRAYIQRDFHVAGPPVHFAFCVLDRGFIVTSFHSGKQP